MTGSIRWERFAAIAVGATGANDTLTSIQLKQGDVGVDYNFGELLPASLFGRVHVDADGDCELDDDEETLAGVVIRLLDVSGTEVDRTTTNDRGEYSFVNLAPAEYTIVEEQPNGFFEGNAKAGSAGGDVTGGSRITNIRLASGETAVNYDFCERPPAQIVGSVFSDRDGDCLFDANEVGIDRRSGRALRWRWQSCCDRKHGRLRQLSLYDLAAGDYTVREIQPPGWLQGGQKAGSAGGDDSTHDSISRIPVGWGQRLTQYNFCELEPSSISGIVFVDGNGDCVQDAGEPPLEGVTIELRDASGRFITSTTTDASGRYTFANLAPGSYQSSSNSRMVSSMVARPLEPAMDGFSATISLV